MVGDNEVVGGVEGGCCWVGLGEVVVRWEEVFDVVEGLFEFGAEGENRGVVCLGGEVGEQGGGFETEREGAGGVGWELVVGGLAEGF